jgi:hypothetical protein
MLFRSLRFFVPSFFFVISAIAFAACSKGGTGDCICRLDPQHPDSGIVTCEGTVGGGQREECKLQDNVSTKPQSIITVVCDLDDDPDETDCTIHGQ